MKRIHKDSHLTVQQTRRTMTAIGVVGATLWMIGTCGSAISGSAIWSNRVGSPDEPSYGIGRKNTITVYAESEKPSPDWYNPSEPMVVEWVADATPAPVQTFAEAELQTYDLGCPDWNYNTTIYGWGGRTMEEWEMDLFARIFYREFWQPNLTLCEAGCDAMLQLWGRNGGTMFETLSHVNEDGSYSFSTYPDVWDIEYNPDGLAWCRAYCEQRFYEGPVWVAQYFRRGQYHDWGEWSPIPAYQIDNIYFSIGR